MTEGLKNQTTGQATLHDHIKAINNLSLRADDFVVGKRESKLKASKPAKIGTQRSNDGNLLILLCPPIYQSFMRLTKIYSQFFACRVF